MNREVPASIYSCAVELFCTFVSDTAIGMIYILISSASANEIVTFVAALDKPNWNYYVPSSQILVQV